MQTDITTTFQEKVTQWEQSQKGQTSGREYEHSFLEMWQELGQAVFQQSVGELPKNKNEKKTADPTGKDRNAQTTRTVPENKSV